VIAGSTSGGDPAAELNRIFFLQLSVLGSTMGTREELERLVEMVLQQRIQPPIGLTLPLREARAGFAAMARGETAGKIVFEP
jgi:D-arabinose 1-dehydrogenase-like Zn-dependent alcohol dehydrogenase